MTHATDTAPGFLAQSRKALVAGAAAGIAAVSPVLSNSLGDGTFTTGEALAALGIFVGAAGVVFAGVWYTPNAIAQGQVGTVEYENTDDLLS